MSADKTKSAPSRPWPSLLCVGFSAAASYMLLGPITAGFRPVFAELDIPLPYLTRAFLSLSQALQHPLGALVFVLGFLGLLGLVQRHGQGHQKRILATSLAGFCLLTLLLVHSVFLPVFRLQAALQKH